MRANLESISHRCRLFEVAFVWDLTTETIHLPLGCLQLGTKVKDAMGRTCPRRWRGLGSQTGAVAGAGGDRGAGVGAAAGGGGGEARRSPPPSPNP